MEEHLLAAEAVANNDRNKTTVASYKRTIANMRKYAEDSIDWSGSIFNQPPLPDNFIKAYLGQMSELKTTGGVRTASTMRSYVSAIKWWYNTAGIRISEELDIWLSRFNKGHKRTIADMKQSGQMDQHEG
jgi:hypothetical protein